MKIVGIQASPRKNGNCDILMDEVFKSAKENGAETNKYYLDDYKIEPCHACCSCGDGVDCIVDDDCNEILNSVLDADVLIFSSPIYYGQMTAQGKLFTDRFYSISRNPQKSFEGKKVVLIFTHAAPTGTYDEYINLTKKALFEYIGFNVVDTIDIGGVQEPGDVKGLNDVISKAKEIGNNL
ncbi:hypothetical protein BGI41_07655 [Methanobrevibacter sp. 87.7]|uniref:flavodoxin family protein n=1 Tax=Methanobrevibacter sp. 87.7 TaxID=387957 RepID=UPI000B4FE24C|nr:flavodoxin family protein [Methanobrevibacter sp. 87.7]OWT32439.1 hypothetical protein BGI41_07655 [Methanobrevibacter sp. 87.7]